MALMAIAAAHRAPVLLDQGLAEFSHHEAGNLLAGCVGVKVIPLVAIGAVHAKGFGKGSHYLGKPLLGQAFKNLQARRGLAHDIFKWPGAEKIWLALMAIVAGEFSAILVL